MPLLYEPHKIGMKIARGGDRTVYMYGNNEVIKFSLLAKVLGKKVHIKMSRDYAISKKYFGDYILKTIDVSQPNTNEHIEIQEYIEGKPFCMEHASNKDLLDQLGDIRLGLNKMSEDGYAPLDLVGNKGMLKPCLSNVFVDSKNKLRIIDTTLLETSNFKILGKLATPLLAIIKLRQNYLLKLLTKQDI